MAAKHSTGKNNFALSTGLIVTIVVVFALIAAVIGWLWLRSDTQAERDAAAKECIEGELTVPVAEQSPGLAEDLLADYEATSPIVRDHCITTQIVPTVTDAALYIAADSDVTAAVLAEAGRSTQSDNAAVVKIDDVGLTGGQGANTDPATVDFPATDQPDASVAVALALTGGDDAAAAAVLQQRVEAAGEKTTTEKLSGDGAPLATARSLAPAGSDFEALGDSSITFKAWALSGDGSVGEEESRAAQAIADFASEHSDAKEHNASAADSASAEQSYGVVTPLATTAAAHSAEESSQQPAAGSDGPTDTLFLVDISEAMTGLIDGVVPALGGAANELAAEDLQAALWNYSSPLNPGVSVGWRANLGFGDPVLVADSVARLGTGGMPQTRSAVLAALGAAGEHAADTGAPVRVVLITTASADPEISDDVLTSALSEQRDNNGVALSVIHIGDGEVDEGLASMADFSTHVEAEKLPAALKQATGI